MRVQKSAITAEGCNSNLPSLRLKIPGCRKPRKALPMSGGLFATVALLVVLNHLRSV